MADTNEDERKPRGKAIDRTDDDLDDLAAISPEDIEAGGDYWRKHAPEVHKGLTDAKADENTDDDEG